LAPAAAAALLRRKHHRAQRRQWAMAAKPFAVADARRQTDASPARRALPHARSYLAVWDFWLDFARARAEFSFARKNKQKHRFFDFAQKARFFRCTFCVYILNWYAIAGYTRTLNIYEGPV
jgi:hypothetical protein